MARSMAVTLIALAEVSATWDDPRWTNFDPWWCWHAPHDNFTACRPESTHANNCSYDTYNWKCNVAEDRCREVVWGWHGPRLRYIECCSIERFFTPYPFLPTNATGDYHVLINPKVCCPGSTGVGEAYWNRTSKTCEICPTSTPYYDRDEGLCKHLCPEGKEPNADMNRCLSNSSMAIAMTGGRRLVMAKCNAENGDCSGPNGENCPDGSPKTCTDPPTDGVLCPVGMICDALPGEGAGCCKDRNPFEYGMQEESEISFTSAKGEESGNAERTSNPFEHGMKESEISFTPPKGEESGNAERTSDPFDSGMKEPEISFTPPKREESGNAERTSNPFDY